MKLEIEDVRKGFSNDVFRQIFLTNGAQITIWARWNMSYEEREGDYLLPNYPLLGRQASRKIQFSGGEYASMTNEEIVKIVQDKLDQIAKARFKS